MQDETKQIIHNAYALATQKSNANAVEIEEALLSTLDATTICQEDIPVMDYFLDKLSKSILARKRTFQATNLCSEILHTTMYIVMWLNSEYGAKIDTNISARRKSLESELAKILELSDRQNPLNIMDRFGIRFILDEGISKCCFLATKIVDIICNLNRQDRKNFWAYLSQFDENTQYRIKRLLDIPFTLTPIVRKDKEPFIKENYPDLEYPTEEDRKMVGHLEGNMKFYFDPKWNGYQSLHLVVAVEPGYTTLPGFEIELQFRTWKMHVHAENDIKASHDAHKDDFEEYARIFRLSDEELSKTDIRFFYSYKDIQNDPDGIHFPKSFYNRRMNDSSVQELANCMFIPLGN